MAIFLETERLVLREFTTDDVDNLVELDADPEVVRWTPDESTSRDEVEHQVLPYYSRYYQETPGFGFWALEERATGEFLGWFHLRPAGGHGPDEPEIGYRLRRSAWGKGYATEGSRALISRAFADHPVRRVLAETSAIHTASRRVMEKCGLRLVREFDAGYPPIGPDDVLGDVEYAIDRVEWERQSATRMENLP
jgi:RimJ/RimL family protein N-acetyltransferase